MYFHHGLNSQNKPSFRWLLQAYRAFDRKYKKNLKALYLVHPTNFIRVIWQLFKPFIRCVKLFVKSFGLDLHITVVFSIKFGKKMMYVNYLSELGNHIHLNQVCIPPPVLQYDLKMTRFCRYKIFDSNFCLGMTLSWCQKVLINLDRDRWSIHPRLPSLYLHNSLACRYNLLRIIITDRSFHQSSTGRSSSSVSLMVRYSTMKQFTNLWNLCILKSKLCVFVSSVGNGRIIPSLCFRCFSSRRSVPY